MGKRRIVNLSINNGQAPLKKIMREKSIANIKHFSYIFREPNRRILFKKNIGSLVKSLKSLNTLELLFFNSQLNQDDFIISNRFIHFLKNSTKLDRLKISVAASKLEQKSVIDFKRQLNSKITSCGVKKLDLKFSEATTLNVVFVTIGYFLPYFRGGLKELSIDLSYNIKVESDFQNFDQFATALTRLDKLEKLILKFYRSKKSGSQLMALGTSLAKMKTLKHLELNIPKWEQLDTFQITYFLRVLANLTNLQVFILILDCPERVENFFTNQLEEKFEDFSHIKYCKIHLKSSAVIKSSLKTFLTSFLKSPEIQHFDLDEYLFKKSSVLIRKELDHLFRFCSNLKSLSLDFVEENPFTEHDDPPFIEDSFRLLSNLERLSLHLEKCTNFEGEYLPTCFKEITKLQELNLQIVGPMEIKVEVLSMLSEIKQLERLEISLSNLDNVTDFNMDEMTKFAKVLRLSKLSLKFSYLKGIGENTIYYLARNLTPQNSIFLDDFSLIFDQCSPIKNTGIEYMSTFIADLENLTKFTFIIRQTTAHQELNIDDSHLIKFTQALKRITKLKELNIEWRPVPHISTLSILFFKESLRRLHNLNTLIINFYGSKVSIRLKQQIRKFIGQLPGLKKYDISLDYLSEFSSIMSLTY